METCLKASLERKPCRSHETGDGECDIMADISEGIPIPRGIPSFKPEISVSSHILLDHSIVMMSMEKEMAFIKCFVEEAFKKDAAGFQTQKQDESLTPRKDMSEHTCRYHSSSSRKQTSNSNNSDREDTDSSTDCTERGLILRNGPKESGTGGIKNTLLDYESFIPHLGPEPDDFRIGQYPASKPNYLNAGILNEAINDDSTDHSENGGGVTLSNKMLSSKMIYDPEAPVFSPAAPLSDLNALQNYSLEDILQFNRIAFARNIPEAILKPSGHVKPHVGSTSVVMSEYAAMNWYGYHKARNWDFDMSKIRVQSFQFKYSLLNHVPNCPFSPVYPVTRSLQATLLERHIHLRFGDVAPANIHIFVDVSNIAVSWINFLKLQHKIPLSQHVAAPPFCFPNLDYILRRNRKATVKMAAGSSRPNTEEYHLTEARDVCKYRVYNLPRVADPCLPGSPRKKKEHFVDESLQLGMASSIMDYKPATMVVATGDGNEAEYSEGFLANICRALSRGWCVELVTFSANISKGYLDLLQSQKYDSKFKVIYLDEYGDLLFAMWVDK